MKETTPEHSGICSKKGNHMKVMIICFTCSLIYLYLYSNLTIRTLAVNDMVQNTLDDLSKWKHKVEGWIRGLSEKSEIQSTTSTTSSSEELNSEPQLVHIKSHTLNVTSKPDVLKQDLIKYTKMKDDAVQHFTDKPQILIENFVKSRNLKDRISALRKEIVKREAPPLITLFTTWPTKVEKFLVHNSTVKNWAALAPFVHPVLFTDEQDLATGVKSSGWSTLPVTKSAIGIPILKYMYIDAMSHFNSTFYAYSNGDILYTESLVETLLVLLSSKLDLNKPLLMVGQRTNVQEVSEEEASSFVKITNASKRGQLFTPYAEDYFITTANYPWKDSAEVVIGRRAYDNWLVLNARKHGHTTVDGTKTLLAVHQTTKAGNYEGHAVPNSNYNDNLLTKMFRRVPYGAGLTSCTSYYTVQEKSGEIDIVRREVHKSCFPL